MKNTTIEVGPMTINVDAMTSEDLANLVKALVPVLPGEMAVTLTNEWKKVKEAREP